MMTLIDTSAWIEFFRAKGNPTIKSRVADFLSLGSATYTCPIRYELFLGARPSEVADLKHGLGFAQRIPLVVDHWNMAADHGALLRKNGFTVPAADLLIATVAVSQKISILTTDDHFRIIQEEALPSLQLA